MTRLYLPATISLLADLDAERGLDAGGAVVADDDSEDAEYDALVTAAQASAALVAGLGDGQRRRVVVVAERPALPNAIRRRDVVAVHADPADDADPDDDLGWYATQEIAGLLG